LRKSRENKGTAKRKREEEAGLRHAIDGFPEFDPKRKDFGMKGTQIRAQSGVRDLNPPKETGVEIKKHFK
jgi:hypothetical protein